MEQLQGVPLILGILGVDNLPIVSFFAQAMVKTNRSTVGGFFLAGRSMTWWPVSGSGVSEDTH